MNKKNKKGFTLVELLAVIVVLIIIMLIAITSIRTYTKRSKEKALTANALSYVKAIDDKSGLDVVGDKLFKNGIFNTYSLEKLEVSVVGTKPDNGYVCVNNYKVESACLEYGKSKVEYQNNSVTGVSKGKCKLENINCDISPLKTYEYTGNYQIFVAPRTSYYKIDLWGASGGSVDNAAGGKGAYTSGVIHLEKGDELYIYVGGEGSSRTYADGTGNAKGGYNGGAVGNVSRANYNQKNSGGGGATDVRLVSGTWNNLASLSSRIMVAGGGGGVYVATESSNCTAPADGGYGGNLTGGNGKYLVSTLCGYSSLTPSGGTQTTGGQSVNDWNRNYYENTYIGTFGTGATGANSYGGGGGGYWGGASGNWKPGAGGSSYISGYKGSVAIQASGSTTPMSGCTNGTTNIECSYHYSGTIFTNGVMKSGDEAMPTHDGSSTMTGNEGDGYAVIYEGYYIEEEPKYSNESETYAYSGHQDTFVAPKAGTYKLEVWGAQGGSYNTTYIGGYGAYSTGQVSLKKGDVLYINVGGQGKDLSQIANENNIGGYNGGGKSYTITTNCGNYAGPGGGATSISTKPGILSNLSQSINKVLIVAGGGGGSSYRYCSGTDYAYSSGGAGGGITGCSTGNTDNYWPYTSSTGGTQTAGGASGTSNGETGGVNGSFGLGGQTTRTGGYTSGAGGGGGFYGGGNGMFVGAGGGSSYIGNSLLFSKEMKCFGCTESTDENTKTTSVDCAEETASSTCAKKGDGYAKISLVN